MSQRLDEQIFTVERSLGERMIDHALAIVRVWLNELGENNPYEQAYQRIQKEYAALFANWLTSETTDSDDTLNALTGEMYRMVDAVYADIRIKRGLSPQMHGFGKEHAQSVMHYFSSCVKFREEDFEWLEQVMDDSDRAAMALMAVAALAKNIRECFSEQAILTLINGISAQNDVVSEQCLANVIILLAHYDVRIDFFPDLQNAFLNALEELDDDGELPFATMMALVKTAGGDHMPPGVSKHEVSVEDLPGELQKLLDMTGNSDDVSHIMAWLPASEQEYMQGLMQIMPDTWVYEVIVGDSAERANQIAVAYLSVGNMDMMWEHTDVAAKWLLQRLRKGSRMPADYINYGHCLMLQGDRMMAYENYRQARQLCKSSKQFFNLFRPDRRQLVDHGVPVEQIYLIEDKLLTI